MNYTLIGSLKSRAFRVAWMLEEAGLEFEHVNAGPRSDEVMAVNPSGKIPAFLVDGTMITDSVAILTYLADRHGVATYPPGTLERARQDALTQFAVEELDGVLWTISRNKFVLPKEHRVPEAIDGAIWEYQRSLARLSTHLGDGPWLMGEIFTIADIVAIHCLGWGIVAKAAKPEGAVSAYLDRARARPAYAATSARRSD
ncbi:MAG: glutathione S-transferase family protein [Pseudomonadota bacterium]